MMLVHQGWLKIPNVKSKCSFLYSDGYRELSHPNKKSQFKCPCNSLKMSNMTHNT